MNILQKIVAKMLPQLEARKQKLPLLELQSSLQRQNHRANFLETLQSPGIKIIAELKKASPSKGIIRNDFNFLQIAEEFQKNGAAAISVLTERNFFLGDLQFLQETACRVDLPLLCKDFIVDEYQLYEAKLFGASAVLLIAALLPKARLAELVSLAEELELNVLAEAHNQEELDCLLDLPIPIIGINARNLQTFHCDIELAETLISQIPAERIAVAESAIQSRDDIIRLQAAGAKAFLIGETLMRANSPGAKLRELLCQ